MRLYRTHSGVVIKAKNTGQQKKESSENFGGGPRDIKAYVMLFAQRYA